MGQKRKTGKRTKRQPSVYKQMSRLRPPTKLNPVTSFIRTSLPAGLLFSFCAGNVAAEVLPNFESSNSTISHTNNGNHAAIHSPSANGFGTTSSISIGAHQSVNIDQAQTAHYTLNSSSSGVLPEQILGSLNSAGSVTLYAQNGIVIGQGATVNVNSLIATSLKPSDNNGFQNGIQTFVNADGSEGGMVVNRGTIQAATGGSVSLIGGAVSNEGAILATAGQVNLVAGKKVIMDFDGDGLMQFAIDEEVLQNAHGLENAVSNSGTINSGSVLLKGSAAKDVFTNVVNNSGMIAANKITNEGGVIKLVASGTSNSLINTGTLNASSDDSDGGTIEIYASDTAIISEDALITAASTSNKGGYVEVTGDRVALLDDATIDASGQTGGGEILIGGDYQGKNPEVKNAKFTTITDDVKIKADAIDSGDGGKVIVWSDNTTEYSGHISARGGVNSGDGGFVEVSGKQHLDIAGLVGYFDLTSAKGSGGTLLLDPNAINIVNTTETDPGLPNYTESGSTTTSIEDADIEGFLAGNMSVTLTTTDDGGAGDDITLDSAASISWNTTALLTLNADDVIQINGTITSTGGGGLTLNAGRRINIDNTVNIGTGALTANANTSGLDTVGFDTGNGVVITAGVANINANNTVSFFSGDLNFTSLTANIGTATLNIDNSSTLTLTGGPSTITASNIQLTATDFISAAGQSLTYVQAGGTNLTLGTGGEVTGAELQNITAGSLTFQTTGAGNITVNGITAANSANISGTTILDAGNDVSFSTGASTFTNALTANADNDISAAVGVTVNTGTLTLNADNDTSNVGAISGAGTLTATTIDLDAATGITATTNATTVSADNTVSGDVTVSDTNNLNISGSNMGGGSFSATAGGAGNTLTVTGSNINANTGSVFLEADEMTLTGTVTGNGGVTLRTETAGTVITLSDASSAGLNFTDATLDQVNTTGTLTIGGNAASPTASGNVTISGATAINPGNASNLTVLSGADIIFAQNAGVTGLTSAGTLTLNADGAVTGNAAAATDLNGNAIVISAANGIGTTNAIETVTSTLTANNTTANNIQIDNTGSLNLGAGGTLTNGAATGDIDIEVLGAGNDLTVSNTVTAGRNVILTANDDINFTQAAATVGVSAGTRATITAGSGSVDGSIVGNANTANDINAANIELIADTGIGNTNEIEINATDGTNGLAATTNTGDINVVDVDGGLTVGLVNATTGLSITTGGAGSDIRVRATEAVAATENDLTINQNVSNAGGGNITLANETDDTADDFNITANIATTGANGNIILHAGRTIAQNGTSSISASGAGAVNIFTGSDFANGTPVQASITANFLQNGTSSVSSTSGDIAINATRNIGLSDISTTGNVTLTADTDGNNDGNVVESTVDAGAVDITANVLTIDAATGVGTAGDAIETTVTSLDVTNDAGATGVINITETDNVTLVNNFRNTVANSAVTLTTTNGSIDTGTATLTSNIGQIDLTANDSTADANATPATITIGTGNVASGGGDINILAADDITLTGTVNATGGAVIIDADSASVTEGSADTDGAITGNGLITAGNLTLFAAENIGVNASNKIMTAVTNLEAIAARDIAGGIYLEDSGVLNIGGIGATTGVSTATAGATSDIEINTANVGGGSITISEDVDAGAGGAIIIQTGLTGAGLNADINVDADITTSAAGISLNASDSIVFSATGSITSSGLSIIQLVANNNSTAALGDTGHVINMNAASTINAGAGTINLTSFGTGAATSGDITVGTLTTTVAGNVTLNTLDAGVVDSGAALNVNAANANLIIDAATGVGSAGAIETTVATIDVDNTTSGNIIIAETNGIDVTQLDNDAANGNVTLSTGAGGTLNVNGAAGVTAASGGVISLDANGTNSVLVLNTANAITNSNADITLESDNRVVIQGGANIISTGTGNVSVTANANDDATGTNDLRMLSGTSINAGSGTVTLANSDGDASFTSDNIEVANLITTNATASAITITTDATVDNLVGAGNVLTATAGGLVIDARTGVGTTNEIFTSVNSIDIDNATSGNIRISEADGVTLTNVNNSGTGTTTSVVTTGAGTMQVVTVDAAAAGSTVTLQTNDGAITDDGVDSTLSSITADGGGSTININAGGAFDIGATGAATPIPVEYVDVNNTGTPNVNVTISNSQSVFLNFLNGAVLSSQLNGSSIGGPANSVNLAVTGNTFTFDDNTFGTIASSNAYDLDVRATAINLGFDNATDIEIATSGNVKLQATAGAIIDTAGDTGFSSGLDVIGATLDLDATTGIGVAAGNRLEVRSSSIAADTTGGDIGMSNTGATAAVTATSLTTGTGVINFQQDGQTLAVTTATTTDGDITVGNQGDISATTVTAGGADGDVQLNTAGVGNIAVDNITGSGATGSVSVSAGCGGCIITELTNDVGADITAQSVTLSAGTGTIGQGANGAIDINTATLTSAQADGSIDLNLLGDVSAAAGLAANHTVDVTSIDSTGTGNITLTGTSGSGTRTYTLVDANNGTIDITATVGDIALDVVTAGTGGTANTVDITAAAGAITDNSAGEGAGNENVVGSVVTLTANTGIGATGAATDIDTAATELDLTTTTGGIFITETDAVQLGNSTGGINTITSGNIEITSTTGTITISDGQAADNVVVQTGGAADTISITAQGVNSDIVLVDAIQSVNGDINLTVDDSILFTDNGGDITSTTGNVSLQADNNNTTGGDSGDVITMIAGSTINAGSGTISLDTNQDGDNTDGTGGAITITELVTTNATTTAVTIDSDSTVRDIDDTAVDVQAANGRLVILSNGGIVAGPNGDIETTVASIDILNEVSGSISIDETDAIDVIRATNNYVTAATDFIAITSTNAGDINLTTVDGGALGGVQLSNANGAITDANAGTLNITAGNLLMIATTGIGTVGDPLEINATTVAARTESGDMVLTDTAGGLTVGTVDFSGFGGSTLNGLTILDATANDSGGDEIRVTTTGSFLTVDQAITNNDAGNVTLDSGALLTINNVVSSTSAGANAGNIDLTGATGVTHTAAGDLTTAGTGTIDVTATANDITMADGTVYSTGSGTVALDAGTNVALGQINTTSSAVNVTAGVVGATGAITDATATETANITTSGTATLIADEGIGSAGGAADIDTTIGSLSATNNVTSNIVIEETNGLIVTSAVQTVDNDANDITITATTGNIEVDSINTGGTAGDVNLVASAGAVTDRLADALLDITADVLTIDATTGVGSANALDTTVVSIDIDNATSGNIQITDTNGVIVTKAAQATDNDANDITITSTTGNIEVDSITTGGGTAGDVNLNAVAGAVTDRLADALLDVSADVLTIDATTGVGSANALDTTVVSIDIDNATSGNIQITDTNGVIVTKAAQATDNDANDITITSTTGNIEVDSITTGGGTAGDVNLVASAGAVTDRLADTVLDVSAQVLTIDATTGVGAANALDTSVVTLDIDNTTSGNVDINETDAVTVFKAAQATAGNVQVVAGGTITVDNADAGNAITTAGAGTITLDANGTTSDVLINDGIQSVNGAINITADNDVTFQADGDIASTAGAITVTADADNGGAASGALTMVDGTVINAGNATIALNADENITLGRLVTTNATTSAVTLTSTEGAITDGGDTGGVDVEATAGRLVVSVVTGTGTAANAIETTVDSVSITNSTSGDIHIDESTALDIIAATTLAGGNIDIATTAGALTVVSGAAADVVSSNGGGSIALTSNGGNLNINDGVRTVNSTITLDANGTNASVISSADGDLNASSGITITSDAQVTLAGDVTVTTSGPISITANSDGVLNGAETGLLSNTGTIGNALVASVVTLSGNNVTMNGDVSTASSVQATATTGAITGTGTVRGAQGVFTAATTVGTSAASRLSTRLGILEAVGTGVFISEFDGLQIGGAGVGALTGVSTTGGSNGNIDIVTAGTFTSNENITADGAGTITLDANGVGSDYTLNTGTISSGSGLITITADDRVTLSSGAGGVGTTGTSAITITANADGTINGGEDGILNLVSGSLGNATAGVITLTGQTIDINQNVLSSSQINMTAAGDIDTTGSTSINASNTGIINLRVDSGNATSATLTLGSGTVFNAATINFTGGNAGGNDTINGSALAIGNTWTVTGANIGTLANTNVTTATSAGYTNFQNLTGGVSTDLFDFNGGTVSGNIDGQAGSDTLDYAGATAGTGSVTLNAIGTTDGFSGLAGGAGNITGTYDDIDVLVGSSGTDTLTGINAAAVWTIDNTTNDTYVASGRTLTFNSATVENLTGNAAADTYNFTENHTGNVNAGNGDNVFSFINTTAGTGLTGNVTTGTGNDTFNFGTPTGAPPGTNRYTIIGSLDGGNGSDTVDYSGTALDETINITGAGSTDGSQGTFTGNGGDAALVSAGFDNINSFTGNGLGTFTGPNANTFWNVTGANSGTYGATLADIGDNTFANFDVVAGSADDVFVFQNNATARVAGGINGGAGTNTLAGSLGVDTFVISAVGGTTVTITPAGGAGATTLTNITNIDGANATDDGTTNVGDTGADIFNISNTWNGSISGTGGNDDFNFDAGGVVTGNVDGGAGDDIFDFNGGTVTGNVDGQGGSDTLDYAGATAGTGSVTLNAVGATDGFAGLAGSAGNITGTIDDIDVLVGSSGTDTLTGINADATWTINGGGTTYTTTSGTARTLTFSAMENLTGNAGADTFNVGGAHTGNIDTAGGDDIVNVAAALTGGISSASGNNDFNLNAGGSVSLNITGGTGNDIFDFNGGTVTGNVDGAAGTNTIDYAGAAAGNVTLNAVGGTTGFSGLAGGASQITGTFDDITTVVGSAGTDTLTGISADATWIVNGGGTTYTTTSGTARTLTFSAMENLTGNAGADIFNVTGAHTGNLLGGAGNDTFDIAATLTGSLDGEAGVDILQGTSITDVVLTGSDADGFAGTEADITANFDGIQTITGNGAGTTLTGSNTTNTWALDGTPTFDDGTASPDLNFTNFATLQGGTMVDTFNISSASTFNLNGGAGADDFNFDSGALTGNVDGEADADIFDFNGGSVTGNVDGNTGSDTLDYAGIAGSITVTLNAIGGTDGFSGAAGGATNITGTFDDIDVLVGSSGTDTLTGINAVAVWTVNNTTTDTYVASGRTLTFNSATVENLTGNAAADTFTISDAHTGTIDTAGGDDILNLSAALTGGVTSASGNNDFNFDGGGTVSLNVTGGTGNDTFDFNGGSVTGSVNGGTAGTNTLDYAGVAGPITTTIIAVGTNVGFQGTTTSTGGFNNITALTGSAGSDTLVGANLVSTFNLTGANSGNYNSTNALNFSSVENLTGGTSADTFNITSGATLTGTISGGASTDTLTQADGTNTWDVTAANSGDVTDIGDFNNIENLTGGTGNDTFNVGNTLSGLIDGGAHIVGDTANFTAGQTVALNGTNTGITRVENVDMNGGGTLVGNATGNTTWDLNLNGATGDVSDGTTTVRFTNTPNIQNGAGGTNTFNATGGPAANYSGGIALTGSNNTWIHTAGSTLTTGAVTGAGALTIPGVAGTDLDIGAGGLLLPNLTGFNGHTIIGGALTAPGASPFTSATAITINIDTLNVVDVITTGGELTLLGGDIDLNANITTGGTIGMIAAGAIVNAGLTGSITAETPVTLTGPNAALIASDNIESSIDITLTFGGGEIDIAKGNTDEIEFNGASTFTDTTTAAEFEAFVTTVGSGNIFTTPILANVNITGLTITQAFSINPASSLIGLETLAFIDLGLFEEELQLYGVIGTGIALALAQCEEQEGCAPNVTEDELNNLIESLEARLSELDKRWAEEIVEAVRAELLELINGYNEELDEFRGYRKELQDFFAAEDDFGDDDFDDGSDDDSDFLGERTVEVLAKVLETVKARIEWLESLKGNPNERARLGQAIGIDLTQEALDEIIEAAKSEAVFIENQIKLLIEGTEAMLEDNSSIFTAEAGDYDSIQTVHYGTNNLLSLNDESVKSLINVH